MSVKVIHDVTSSCCFLLPVAMWCSIYMYILQFVLSSFGQLFRVVSDLGLHRIKLL